MMKVNSKKEGPEKVKAFGDIPAEDAWEGGSSPSLTSIHSGRLAQITFLLMRIL